VHTSITYNWIPFWYICSKFI